MRGLSPGQCGSSSLECRLDFNSTYLTRRVKTELVFNGLVGSYEIPHLSNEAADDAGHRGDGAVDVMAVTSRGDANHIRIRPKTVPYNC
jgi:hypothetical protein